MKNPPMNRVQLAQELEPDALNAFTMTVRYALEQKHPVEHLVLLYLEGYVYLWCRATIAILLRVRGGHHSERIAQELDASTALPGHIRVVVAKTGRVRKRDGVAVRPCTWVGMSEQPVTGALQGLFGAGGVT